nr:MAG TPA: hypothetical protein [Caudoviricetes sp.]
MTANFFFSLSIKFFSVIFYHTENGVSTARAQHII